MAHSAPDTTKKRGKHPNEPPEQLEFPTVFRTADGPHEPGAGQRSNPVRPSSTRSREEPSSEPFMTWAPQKKVGRVTPAGIGGGGGANRNLILSARRVLVPGPGPPRPAHTDSSGPISCQWAERPREAEPNPGEYTGRLLPNLSPPVAFPISIRDSKTHHPSLPPSRSPRLGSPSVSLSDHIKAGTSTSTSTNSSLGFGKNLHFLRGSKGG